MSIVVSIGAIALFLIFFGGSLYQATRYAGWLTDVEEDERRLRLKAYRESEDTGEVFEEVTTQRLVRLRPLGEVEHG